MPLDEIDNGLLRVVTNMLTLAQARYADLIETDLDEADDEDEEDE